MLKQSSSRMKKVLASLLVVFFVVSVTAAAVSAEPAVVKAAKGMVINRETGADQADIEMIMKFLGDENS